MSCLHPITIRVRSKVLDLQGAQSYNITVPCGHCAECLKQKRDEWYFRSYYEARSTIEDGGYVYFDTLTYNDNEVPHLTDVLDVDKLHDKFGVLQGSLRSCDYMCFDRRDIKDFFKRLRRQLDYYGYKSSECFKYFLTSEYGTSETGTHRPHYHVLFFIKDPSLDPIDFSRFVNKCWQHGRTDGIDYHGRTYVLNHTYGKGYSADMLACQKACSYVSKYITKDSHYEREIKHRIWRIMDKLFGFKWCAEHGIEYHRGDWHNHIINGTDYVRTYKELVKSDLEAGREYIPQQPSVEEDYSWDEYPIVKSSNEVPSSCDADDKIWDDFLSLNLFDDEVFRTEVIMSSKEIKALYDFLLCHLGQFHMQSQQFGASFLDYNDYTKVMEEGLIYMPDAKKGVKYIPLPRYYQMKIFYGLHRDFNGHLYYALNDEGKAFKLLRLKKGVDTLTMKIMDWQLNMMWHDYYTDDSKWYENLIQRFNKLNNGRDIKDFAEYLLFYKGRIKSAAQLEREANGVFKVDDMKDWFCKFYCDITKYSDVVYNYACPTDKDMGLNCITRKWLGDSESWSQGQLIPSSVYGCEPWLFEERYVMDDKCDPRFAHYDEMFDIYCRAQEFKAKFKQESFDEKEELAYRLKNVLKK